MNKVFIFLILLGLTFASKSQITSNPALPTATDEVVITFDATQGNGNLAGYTGDVYTHTGVKIEGNPNWQYVIGTWGNNTTQPKLTRIGTNLYQLTITPSIRQFYDVPADMKIVQMCFVFRASGGSPQSEDLFVDIVEEGLTVKINSPQWDSPFYNFGALLNIEAQANSSENITLFVNNQEVSTTSNSLITYTHTVDLYGKQWVKAVATAGSESVADSVYFYVRGEVPVVDLPSGVIPGINITGEDEVTLVLHDPPALKQFVFAIGDFNDWELDDDYYMNRTPDGKHYWITLSDLDPTKEYIYQYWIDGELRLADPYTEKVSDPWNDKWISSITYPNLIEYPVGKTSGIASVFQVQQEEYVWEATDFVPPAKGDLIIYELHIRDFVEDDYIMTVLDKLDYLQTLGVNAIELMPINEFEGNDSWGYNPSFFFATDKAYGTKNNYKKFIDECHKRGIAVIIDMVLNHSFGQSPLVQMYFNPSAGQYGQPTAENPWYNETCPHPPYCWGYDFDHMSQYTRDFIDRVAEFWLTEFKVDGFRFDFTKGFTNMLTGGEGWNYNAQRVAILKRFADVIWEVNPDAYVILEHFTDNTEEKELAEYRSGEGKGMMLWGNINHAYNEASMGWLTNSNFNWVSHKQRGWSVPHLIGYMESHDEERLMYKNLTYGNSSNPNHNVKELAVALERQKLVGTFYFTIPGPKMIWQFGELGYDVNIDFNGRTGRKPIRWNYYDVPERRSLYNIWAEIIALRHTFPSFSTDNFSTSLSGAGKSITLLHNDMNVYIVGNFAVTEQNISASFPNTGVWYEYFTQTEHSIQSTSQTFTMAPGEYRIYTTQFINRQDYIVGTPTFESIAKNSVSVWPNPASDRLTIGIIANSYQNVEIDLYDMSGRLVSSIYKGQLMVGENRIDWVRNPGIRSGMYLVMVKTQTTRETRKIVIQ